MNDKEKYEAIKKAGMKLYVDRACALHPKDYDYQSKIIKIMQDLFLLAWSWGWADAKQDYTLPTEQNNN